MQKRYVIAWYNLSDNELHLKIINADNEQDAIRKLGEKSGMIEEGTNTLNGAKYDAFNQDGGINIIEI